MTQLRNNTLPLASISKCNGTIQSIRVFFNQAGFQAFGEEIREVFFDPNRLLITIPTKLEDGIKIHNRAFTYELKEDICEQLIGKYRLIQLNPERFQLEKITDDKEPIQAA